MSETTIHPTVKVARDLRALADMHEALLVQAIHKANDRLMPGGSAMVALAGVGSPEEWSEGIAAAEFHHLAACPKLDHARCRYAEHAYDEDGQEPPLQTLLFWSEAWRAEKGYALDKRPSIATETGFLRGALDWAWENEPMWDHFANDVASAKTRLENLLYAGERAERGAPCLYEPCGGARLVRKIAPARDEEGRKVWRHTDWHCPKCKRSWNEDAYSRMVTAGHEAAKVEVIDGETWCTVDVAARKVERSPSTIRQWVHRREVATLCILVGRRLGFVKLEDVETRHETAKRRKRAA